MVTKKTPDKPAPKYGKITPYKMPTKPQGGYAPKNYESRKYTPAEEASYTRHFKSHMEKHIDYYKGRENHKEADKHAHSEIKKERENKTPNPSGAPLSPPNHDKLVKHETSPQKSETKMAAPSSTPKKIGPSARGHAQMPIVPKEGPSSPSNKGRATVAFGKSPEVKTIDPTAASKARKTTRSAAKKPASSPTEATRNGPKIEETRHTQPVQFGKHAGASKEEGSSSGKHSSDSPIYHALASKYGSVAERPKPTIHDQAASAHRVRGGSDMTASSSYSPKHAMTRNGPKAPETDHLQSPQFSGKHAGAYQGKHRKG